MGKGKTTKASSPRTPTVAEVRRMTKLKEYVPNEEDVFQKGDTVFVRHAGMSGIQPNGDKYYKITIFSIHRDKDDDDVIWFLGTWCRTASDLKGVKIKEFSSIIKSLGTNELVKTDHYEVFNAECIVDICHMHNFEDTGTAGFPIMSKYSWFNRLELRGWDKDPTILNINLHCICNRFYDPETMMQRFCSGCKRWFDEGCMTAVSDPAVLQGTTATEVLRAVPYLRGDKYVPKGAVRWTTIGTGVIHDLVEEHAEEVDSEGSIETQWKQWDKILVNEDAVDVLAPKVPGYVPYVRKTKFSWFGCPVCKEKV